MLRKTYCNVQELNDRLDRIEKLTLVSSKNVLTLDEAVIVTGLSKGYIYRLTSARSIPHYKHNGRGLYFKKDEIEKWLTKQRIKTQSEIDSEATTYLATKKYK